MLFVICSISLILTLQYDSNQDFLNEREITSTLLISNNYHLLEVRTESIGKLNATLPEEIEFNQNIIKNHFSKSAPTEIKISDKTYKHYSTLNSMEVAKSKASIRESKGKDVEIIFFFFF